MASDRKIAANRKNAEKSTGPRTERGKARSSMNARKYELSKRDLIPGEDFREYKAHYARHHAELQPVGAIETFLVRQIADITWRMRRVTFLENACEKSVAAAAAADAKRECGHVDSNDPEAAEERETRLYALAYTRRLPALIALGRRREAMAKMYTSTYKELRRMQTAEVRALFPEKPTPRDDASVLAFRA